MDKKNISIGLAILLAGVGLILAFNNTQKLSDSEWTCIAQECTEFATGDDWVKENCNLVNSEMVCDFEVDGQRFRVPLTGVNVSNMISCKEYKCASKVLISYEK